MSRGAATVAVMLSFLVIGCGSAGTQSSAPPAPTTNAPAPSTTTTLGLLPPATVNGLHISPASAPAGLGAPAASWLRVVRPDHQTQLVAVYRPAAPGPHPVVVYLHGSSGLAAPQLAWAQRLARHGFIVVAGCYLDVDPDASKRSPRAWISCPGLPDGNDADVATTTRAYEALLDTAGALPDAKPGGLGVFGVSYGGIVALTASEPRVKAIVSDSGAGRAGAGPVTVPVLMLGMQTDPNESHALLAAFEQRSRAAHKPVDSHYYPGTGHVATLGAPAIANDATNRTVAFFQRHVG